MIKATDVFKCLISWINHENKNQDKKGRECQEQQMERDW